MIPLVDLPLMDSTLSPFCILPSLSARLPAITLCTCNEHVIIFPLTPRSWGLTVISLLS